MERARVYRFSRELDIDLGVSAASRVRSEHMSRAIETLNRSFQKPRGNLRPLGLEVSISLGELIYI